MKKKTKIIGGIIAVVVAVLIFSSTRTKPIQYDTTTVTLQNVRQQVTVTGKVKPSEELALAFEQSGKVTDVNVKVGDHILQNVVLANLSSADTGASLRRAGASITSAQADVAQYQAALESERVKLDQLKSGNRSEELSISEANLQKARSALLDAQNNLQLTRDEAVSHLQNAYTDVSETLQSVYNTANAAFLEEVDPLFTHDTDFDRLNFMTKSFEKRNTVERERITAKQIMEQFQNDLQNMPSEQSALDALLITEKQRLSSLREFFTTLSSAVDDNANLSLTTENLYRGYVNTGRASVNSALSTLVAQQQAISGQKTTNNSSIQAAEASINAAQKAVEIASQELDLKRAGARPEEIAAQESRVKQAEANVMSARARVSQASADYQGAAANFNKTVLRSPIAGIVTVVNAKVGQFMGSSQSAISIISDADYEVEANVPEVDIAKIALGKTADVTLDAYGDEVVFKAVVSKIDPAETVVEGVATYKITLQFLQKDDRIKSGMTANMDILIDQHNDVIAVASRAVNSQDNKRFVKVLKTPESVPEDREVETGLRGSDGNWEIKSGLRVGEIVVLSEITK
jgi:RND family efflux transporter MFP subunit